MSQDLRKRVAVYCRVSTDQEDQIHSMENQKQYFSSYLSVHSEWKLTEIYADEGLSGTNTEKRAAFCRMIRDAVNGNLDLILTKEISRFARNTLDSIFYIRKLKSVGVGVIFMNENINTLDSDAELRLTIFSSIAQEESRKISERVKWGQARRMEQGVVFGRSMLGYDIKNGQMTLNPQGAKIVQLIYHKFLNNKMGCYRIAKELSKEKIPTASGKTTWSAAMVLKILHNEKYCGDLVQKKTITPDYLTHQKKYNHGEEPLIILHDHHEPIVSREDFEKVQCILSERSEAGDRKGCSNRYCFSGKIVCGQCSMQYISRSRKTKNMKLSRSWKCYRAHTKGVHSPDGCQNPPVHEEKIKECLQMIVSSLSLPEEQIIQRIQKRMSKDNTVFQWEKEEQNRRMIRLQEQSDRLIELYLEKEISRPEFKEQRSRIQSELEKIQFLKRRSSQTTEMEIISYLHAIMCGAEWDDIFYKNILKEVVVKGKTLEVFFHHLEQSWCCNLKNPV